MFKEVKTTLTKLKKQTEDQMKKNGNKMPTFKERMKKQFKIFSPTEWKKGFNNNVVAPAKWMMENPDKVKKADDTIEKFYLAFKGGRK
jgi:hypothetical protein